MDIRYATAFSDLVLVVCCGKAIFSVLHHSVTAVLGFSIIASAASVGVVRFSTGRYRQYHEKLSNMGASLGMPLILCSVLWKLAYSQVYIVALIVAAVVLTARSRRSEGETLAGFCILSLCILSVLHKVSVLALASALYVVSAVLLNFKTVAGIVSTTDIFHYLISVAIILFSLFLSN